MSYQVEDLLTKEELTSNIEMLLKVKKPDYLGESIWEFRRENRGIIAKIDNKSWLQKFQDRKIDIRPGDSIRAKVCIKTKYGYDMDVVSIRYNILNILETIPINPPHQSSL